MDDGQCPKTLLQIITHHRQNPLDFIRKKVFFIIPSELLKRAELYYVLIFFYV
jgi:hypothetical protein